MKKGLIFTSQFMGPNMGVIEDNAQHYSVNGNVYSKRVELVFMGQEFSVCDAISVRKGLLPKEIITLMFSKNEKLFALRNFNLK